MLQVGADGRSGAPDVQLYQFDTDVRIGLVEDGKVLDRRWLPAPQQWHGWRRL